MVEEEETIVKSETVKQSSFWDKYKSYILLGLVGIFFFLAHTQDYINTDVGLLFTGLTILTTIIFLMVTIRPAQMTMPNDEFAKDPNFYFRYVKEYYAQSKSPRLYMDLTWSGRSLYFPLSQPLFIILDLYDRLTQTPMICIVRIMRNDQQIRGLFKSTWHEFMHNTFFRMKLAGFISSKGEQINLIGKDGKPISMPGEYIDILQDRGIL